MIVGEAAPEPWGSFTTVSRVIALQGEGLRRYGGRAGPADPQGCVDGALGAALNAESYFEGRRHVLAGLPFAGFVLFYIAKKHCFVDGNKRAAWSTAADVLASLGLGIHASDDEAVELVEAVLAGHLDGADVVNWLAPRLHGLS
jgi:death on curing protein